MTRSDLTCEDGLRGGGSALDDGAPWSAGALGDGIRSNGGAGGPDADALGWGALERGGVPGGEPSDGDVPGADAPRSSALSDDTPDSAAAVRSASREANAARGPSFNANMPGTPLIPHLGVDPTSGNSGRALHLHILGSGSKGNCALVEGPEGYIMIDDGFSRREVLRRMHELNLDETRVQALVLTHEHSDHVSGVSVWCKRFDGALFASEGTADTRAYLSCLPFCAFEPGETLEIAGVRVETFATAHDVVNPTGFRFSYGGDAIGYATDTGTLPPDALRLLADARILALESNHDVPMLRTGSYPRMLQDRILSARGHLSNAQAAEAVTSLVSNRTEQVVAMHISQENNRPSLAVRALAEALGASLDDELETSATLARGDGPRLSVRAAGQNIPISIW